MELKTNIKVGKFKVVVDQTFLNSVEVLNSEDDSSYVEDVYAYSYLNSDENPKIYPSTQAIIFLNSPYGVVRTTFFWGNNSNLF